MDFKLELVLIPVTDVDRADMTEQGWQPGCDPGRADYNSFADFSDPDGNTWVLQESNRYAG